MPEPENSAPENEAPKPAPPAQSEAPKVDETDWKAEARKWEQRAKENKSASDELAQIRESQKTEAEKVADRLAAAEKRAVDAEAAALRFKIAAQHGISDEDADLFLTGTDEGTLKRQAERLSQRADDRKKQGNHVPSEGANPTATRTGSTAEMFAEAIGDALNN